MDNRRGSFRGSVNLLEIFELLFGKITGVAVLRFCSPTTPLECRSCSIDFLGPVPINGAVYLVVITKR